MSRERSLMGSRWRRRASRARGLVGLVVIASAVTACGGSNASSSSSASSSPGTSSASHVNAPSGNLVVLTSAIGTTISPTNGSTTQTPTSDVYDTLLSNPETAGKNGLAQYNYNRTVPELATGYTHKGDAYIFTLRRGFKSCTGNTLTSADVVYSAARAAASPDTLGSPTAAAAAYNTAGVFPASVLSPAGKKAAKGLNGEVKALGPYKVEIVAHHDNGTLPLELSQFPTAIFDSKAAKAHATPSDPWSTKYLATHAAGFGPYCLANWSPSNNSFTLTANPGYFFKAGFHQILVRGVSTPSTELAALQSGQADVVDSLTPDEYRSAASSAAVHVLTDFGSTLNLIMPLNEKIAPFSGPKGLLVRRAVALALPYKAIIQGAMQGQAQLFPGFIPDTIAGAASYPSLFQTNISKAKQLLAQAGYANGTGLPTAGLKLYYQSEMAGAEEPVALAIKAALAKIGMNIELNPLPGTQYTPRQFGPHKDLPMSLQDAGVGLYNGFYYLQSWYVPTTSGGFVGVGNYDNSTVNSAYLAGSSTTNGASQKHDLTIAQNALAQTLPVIPIAHLPLNAAIRSNITGIVVSGPGLMYLAHARRT